MRHAAFRHHHFDPATKRWIATLTHVLEAGILMLIVAGVYDLRADNCLQQSHHGCVVR